MYGEVITDGKVVRAGISLSLLLYVNIYMQASLSLLLYVNIYIYIYIYIDHV